VLGEAGFDVHAVRPARLAMAAAARVFFTMLFQGLSVLRIADVYGLRTMD
jgi:hypothetical protein